MTRAEFWCLDVREFDALVRVFEDARAFQTGLVAELRADLHNNGFREWGKRFEAADFLPGATEDLEAKVEELVAKGWNRAAAAAAVSSKKPKEQNLRLINAVKGGGEKKRSNRRVRA